MQAIGELAACTKSQINICFGCFTFSQLFCGTSRLALCCSLKVARLRPSRSRMQPLSSDRQRQPLAVMNCTLKEAHASESPDYLLRFQTRCPDCLFPSLASSSCNYLVAEAEAEAERENDPPVSFIHGDASCFAPVSNQCALE